MRKLNKVIGILSAVSMLTTALVACGGDDATDGKYNGPRTLSLAVQVETLTEGECNAFVATATGMRGSDALVYEISYNSGDFKAVKTTTDRTLVYRCNEAGEYSVRVATADGKVVSSKHDFEVKSFGGDTFGRSPSGEKPTNNVDLSADFGENPSIEHKAVNTISDEYAFVKGVSAQSFYFTATVDIVGTNAGDQNPKSGLFCKSGTTMYYYAFDVKPHLTGDEIVFVKYTSTGGWGWPGKVMRESVSFRDGDERVGNELGMLRAGDTFYLFLNGKCIGKAAATGFDADSSVGTYTMAQNTVFSKYKCYDEYSEQYIDALARGRAAFN